VSQEREGPAKWQIRQDYKRVNERYVTLLNQIQEWAGAMSRIGAALSPHPEAIAQVDSTGIPDLSEFNLAKQEILGLKSKLSSLRDDAMKIGVDDL
jgi:hypothetical protein